MTDKPTVPDTVELAATLSPCPFCCGSATLICAEDGHTEDPLFAICCTACAFSLPWSESSAEAIAAWNKRASTSTPAPIDVQPDSVLGFRPTIGIRLTAQIDCSECHAAYLTEYIGSHNLNNATDWMAGRAQEFGWTYFYDAARPVGERCTWRCPNHSAMASRVLNERSQQ